jgi:OOP family OmpA-OmpF porin
MPVRTGESPEQHSTPDTRLAEALKPTVEAALKCSVRDEPQPWIEALFPILLPAIRLAVTSALREMVQTLNQALEHALSLRSWRWRLESWRSGRSFAEVVLLRTLVYRVEQVLLLDRNTGLLLKSVAAPNISPKDTHQISGMLTAIQEFVRDSFDVEQSVGIRELHIGDFSLWVEQGPQAAIAAAVRGNAPAELRETLRAAIDLVHQEFGAELREFRGDAKPFEQRCQAILEGCLQSRHQEPEKTSYWKLWLCTTALAAAAFLWTGLRFQESRQWNRALEALSHVPGIKVTQVYRRGGSYVLEGLRDPLAGSPEGVLADNGIDLRKASLQFEPFFSLDPEMVVKRVRATLKAPQRVAILLDHHVLKIEGAAPHAWILEARNDGRQLALAGVYEVRTDGLRDIDLDALRTDIEALRILFPLDSSFVSPAQAGLGKTLAEKTGEWISGAVAIGRAPRVEVMGCTDSSGTEERNQSLSRERAERMAAFLLAAGVRRETLTIHGYGTCPTAVSSALDAAPRRSATLRLVVDAPGSGAERAR